VKRRREQNRKDLSARKKIVEEKGDRRKMEEKEKRDK